MGACMTSDEMTILHHFRIGSRHVERCCAEIAAHLDILPNQANQLIGELVKKGFIKGRKTNDPKIRSYFLSDKGKAWLSVQPVKRGRVLTAVPK